MDRQNTYENPWWRRLPVGSARRSGRISLQKAYQATKQQRENPKTTISMLCSVFLWLQSKIQSKITGKCLRKHSSRVFEGKCLGPMQYITITWEFIEKPIFRQQQKRPKVQVQQAADVHDNGWRWIGAAVSPSTSYATTDQPIDNRCNQISNRKKVIRLTKPFLFFFSFRFRLKLCEYCLELSI